MTAVVAVTLAVTAFFGPEAKGASFEAADRKAPDRAGTPV
jgi:hypothetical protein